MTAREKNEKWPAEREEWINPKNQHQKIDVILQSSSYSTYYLLTDTLPS